MTRSRVWPLVWVGASTSCVRLKQSSSWRNSAAKRQVEELTWIFISPSTMVLADIVQKVERRLDISGMKDGFGWPVNKKYCRGERVLTFKCKAFKRSQLRQGYTGQDQITSEYLLQKRSTG